MAQVTSTSPSLPPGGAPGASPARSAAGRRRVDYEALLFSLPAFIVVFGLFLYPSLYGVFVSLHGGEVGEGPFTFASYRQLLSDPTIHTVVWTTFVVALPVTLFTVVAGVPLAYIMRHGVRFERAITTLLILPLTLGSVMVAQGMLGYFGEIGWFNRTLQSLHIINQPLHLLHNWLGVEIALFIQGFPFVFLLILGYMSAINPDLERASRMLGASAWQTFWRVILPLALPGIAVAVCLNFVANFGVFPTANLVGDPAGATRVLSIAAYETSFSDLNLPLGIAIGLLMGFLELIVIAITLWLQRRVASGASISGGKGA